MLSHCSSAFGSWKFPNRSVYPVHILRASLTFNKPWHKTVCSAVDETTFAGNADGGKDVVSGDHNSTNIRGKQLLQHSGGRRLKLILENDETNEVEATFDIRTCHLLSFDPTKLLKVAGSTPDDTVTFVSIVRQKIIIVAWNYER